jgi:hypothetical protein
MFKLLSGTVLVLTAMACSNGPGLPGTGGGVSGGSGARVTFNTGTPMFELLRGDPMTQVPANATRSDSVVVVGGQMCVVTSTEIKPPTNPPTYLVRTVCR